MMISLGITNPLAAFVNRQPESINQRDARFPAVASLQLPAASLLWGTALRGTSFPPSLEELCTLAFTRAGDPIWKAAGNWDASHDPFLGSRQDKAVFASKAKHSPQSAHFGSRQFSRTMRVSSAWSFIRARYRVHLGFKACSKSLSRQLKNCSSTYCCREGKWERSVRSTGSFLTSKPSRSPLGMSQMLLVCLGASKSFQAKSVMQVCVIHMANVVGKCCCCCFWEVLVYINGMRNLARFLPYPSPGCYFSLWHCCKWDLSRMIFSFPIVTEILLWALGESPSPWSADIVAAWSLNPPGRLGQVLPPWWTHWDSAGEGESLN